MELAKMTERQLSAVVTYTHGLYVPPPSDGLNV